MASAYSMGIVVPLSGLESACRRSAQRRLAALTAAVRLISGHDDGVR